MPPTPHNEASSSSETDEQINRRILLAFYEERDPDKVTNIDKIIARYTPEKMVEVFTKKYGEVSASISNANGLPDPTLVKL